jgi:aminomethyltransferase
MKRTPFYPQHLANGANMYEIQGWEMPAEYAGIKEEHLAIRQHAGLLDFASTGEIEVKGKDALALVQRIIVNDASSMPAGKVLYSTMCRPDGSILSDITVYRYAPDHLMIMTAWGSNRDNKRVEYDWLRRHADGLEVFITDVSSGSALLALQGPRSRDILTPLTSASLAALPYMHFALAPVAGIDSLVSRTGYTGELGYEVVFPAEHAHELFEAILDSGKPHGMKLCGLKSAFGLRMEKGYIARFDFADGATPYEVGLGWTVKLGKRDFIGREALVQQKAQGITRKLVSIRAEGSYVPSMGALVMHKRKPVGKITSSAFSFVFECPLALGYMPSDLATPGTSVVIQDGDIVQEAAVVPRPYYDPQNLLLKT